MPSVERRPSEHSPSAVHRRKVPEWVRKHFPAEISDSYHGLADAGELVASGHGLVLLGTHFSLRDGPGMFLYVASQNDAMIDKPWVAPVARHITEIARLANWVFGARIDLKPVVTASTMEKPRFHHLHRGEGLRDYIISATDTLKRGGVVALFPQSTRVPYLKEPDEYDKAMEFLMSRTSRAQVNDFGILPVGFGVEGVQDYKKLRGLNPGVKYTINVGKLWTKTEALEMAHETQRSMDGWAIDQLRQLVPENYRDIPPSGDIFTAPKLK